MKTNVSFLAFALLALIGCGGASGQADVDPAPMPQGGTFTGVWFSPQYGELRMRQTGTTVIGEYTKDERDGRIQGTAEGNLLRFQWTENRELIRGRRSETNGHGYFQLLLGEDNSYYVVGEWGHDDAEVGGGPWRAVRSRNARVVLSTDTTGGEAGSGSTGGGEYDEYDEDTSGGTEDSSSPPPSDDGDTGGDTSLDDMDL